MRLNKVSILAFLLAVACLGSSFGLQHVIIDRLRNKTYVYRPALYLPSSQYVRSVSMGYDQSVASYLFLKSIQCFASSWSLPDNPREMMNYFELVTDLDPKFVAAYVFTLMAVGEEHAPLPNFKGKQRFEAARHIADKGIRLNPNEYQIPEEAGFYCGWTAKNTEAAKYYLTLAVRIPGCPEHIARMLTSLYRKEGLYKQALQKYFVDFVGAVEHDQDYLIDLSRQNIIRALYEWDVHDIKERVLAWKKAHGSFATIAEMERANAFKGISLPDSLGILQKLAMIEHGDMRLPSRQEILDYMERIERPSDHLPPGPHEVLYPKYPGFIVWRELGEDDENFICSAPNAIIRMRDFMYNAAAAEMAERQKRSSKRPLLDLYGFYPALEKYPEPFGGNWFWDPMLEYLHSTTYPGAGFTYFKFLE